MPPSCRAGELAALPTHQFSDALASGCLRSEEECCLCMEPFGAEDEVLLLLLPLSLPPLSRHALPSPLSARLRARLQVLLLPCQHYFHKPCIEQWYFRKAACPLCRV